MSNWINNNIKIEGTKDDIAKLKAMVSTPLDENGSSVYAFDFNKIIPQPKELNMVEGSITPIAIEAAKIGTLPKNVHITFPYDVSPKLDNSEQLKDIRDLIAYGKRYLANIEKYGYATWYGWRIHTWGTQCTASGAELIDETENSLEYSFSTAWNAPDGIFMALSKQFPEVTVTLACPAIYEDSDVIYFTKYQAGAVIEQWNEDTYDESNYNICL